MSVTTDDGYMVRSKRLPMSLTTIPGQRSAERFVTLDELFSKKLSIVRGVIFVACNGYDHVWVQSADGVAASLPAFNISALRKRNLRAELDSFRETCDYIYRKRLMSPEQPPIQIIVIVNKLDLWHQNSTEAANYYLPNCGSSFDNEYHNLLRQVGDVGIRYHVLPAASIKADYKFQTSRGHLSAQSVLSEDQCDASLTGVIDTLEALRAA